MRYSTETSVSFWGRVPSRANRRRLGAGFAGLLISLGLSGCAYFWEDVTALSPEGGVKATLALRYHLLFHKFEPLKVLAESNDADMRARALRMLKEPKQHGGTDEDQEVMLNLLAAAAKSEKQMICRLAAVETLGTFKDPRATKILVEAFPDKDPVVRMATMTSLGKLHDPASLDTLTNGLNLDPSGDVRIAAAKALGNFKQDRATTALVRVLKEEKDGALRYEASLSLKQITGKDLPADATAWQQYFLDPHPPEKGLAKLY